MGSSVSCLCPENSSPREAIIMKQDGELIRFTEGKRVKDVLAVNPHHKIVRCSSDRLVLSGLSQLSCNRLYFLVPEGLVMCDDTYESLIRTAVSKQLIYSKAVSGAGDAKKASEFEIADGDDLFGFKNSPWKPALQTIREVVSPPLNAIV